uniref:amidase family protein n=1 Tax=Acinetobacter ursingii TaxID=108980 RepID=UPI0025B16524
DQADLAIKRQAPLGKLHGIPMTIKDAFKVKGMPCTDGNPEFQLLQKPKNINTK